MRNVRSCLAVAGLAIGLLVVPAAHAQERDEAPVLDRATCGASALLSLAPGTPACTTRAVSCQGCHVLEVSGRVTATAGAGNAGATGRVTRPGKPSFGNRCGPAPGRCSAVMRSGSEPDGTPETYRATCTWSSPGLALFTGVSCELLIRGFRFLP